MNAAVKRQFAEQMQDLAANDLIFVRSLADELLEKQAKRLAAYEDLKRIWAIFEKDPIPYISNEELNSFRR